jgi:DNA-binding winged helix-turn-helix (wHTH) protein
MTGAPKTVRGVGYTFTADVERLGSNKRSVSRPKARRTTADLTSINEEGNRRDRLAWLQ